MRIVIIQKDLRHYREAFYRALLARLKDRDIDLTLYYGRVTEEASYSALTRLANYGTSFQYRRILGKMLWYPVLRKALHADLVITEHASKVLINYILFASQFLGGPKLAFWGHGWNHHTDRPNTLKERVRFYLAKHAHWYFAYTYHVRDKLIEQGFDPHRVTDVQNAVEMPKKVSNPAMWEIVYRELGLGEGSVIGLFCGHMYPERRLERLVAAAKLVREEVSGFKLVLVGAGMSQSIAENAANEHDFIHFVGPAFADRKAAYFAASRFAVFPGLLGLGVVDAFHHSVPPVVTDHPLHGPEIAYLVDGENGLLTEDSIEGLAGGMIRICLDDELHARLVSGCKDWSQRLTVDVMADKFAEGVRAALQGAD